MDNIVESDAGCCVACGGKGGGRSGPCWDCRGTGCAHPNPCPVQTGPLSTMGDKAHGAALPPRHRRTR